MGVSTDGIVCFGILLDEDVELPWESGEWEEDSDIEGWWRATRGYQEPFVIADWDAVSDDQMRAYYEHRREWEEEHPCPVEPVNCCSGEYPMWILAVPGSVQTAHRGLPQTLEVPTVHEAAGEQLLKFCVTYGIEIEEGNKPQWWLCSYCG